VKNLYVKELLKLMENPGYQMLKGKENSTVDKVIFLDTDVML